VTPSPPSEAFTAVPSSSSYSSSCLLSQSLSVSTIGPIVRTQLHTLHLRNENCRQREKSYFRNANIFIHIFSYCPTFFRGPYRALPDEQFSTTLMCEYSPLPIYSAKLILFSRQESQYDNTRCQSHISALSSGTQSLVAPHLLTSRPSLGG